MKFPPYPKYKDSGVDWLGEIPEHWAILFNKRLFKETSRKGFIEDEELLSVTQDKGVVFRKDLEIKVWNPESDTSNYKLICSGDFVISLRSFQGGIEYSRIRGLVSPAYVVMQPVKKFNHEFMRWFLKSDLVISALNLVTTGIRQGKNISYEDFAELHTIIPPLQEQKKIAEFLDAETAKISKLIGKQESLINLLQEKRRALISHTVTKGLNKNAPMRNSGVKWLGTIPEHWKIKKLKYVASLKSGEGITSESIHDEGEYAVYGGNGLRGFTSDFTHNGNFVLIGRQGALCGNVNYAFGKFWASEHAVVSTLRKGYEVLWFGELLRSMNLNQYSQSAAQPGLAVEIINNLSIPVPPLSEQKEIAEYTDAETAKIDTLIQKAQTAIELLQEHHTALISSAVTGKIDVR